MREWKLHAIQNPMKNLNIENNIAKAEDRCTMCYRCINICPKQA
ncbi:MAG: 4Fe-4S binding protein, partial [Lachnospiraceae bacterium]|nr:4Fe-4S binding protein [Lachnospiraceae bacterium]